MGGDTIHVGFLDGDEYYTCYSQNCFATKADTTYSSRYATQLLSFRI